MNKGLEKFELLKMACEKEEYFNISDDFKKACEIIEKSLKALEIIKEKEVVISILIRTNTLDEYNNNPMFVLKLLTQEEYDLLKEVLL